MRFSNICRLACLFLFGLLNTSFTTWLWKDKRTTPIKKGCVHDFFSIIDVFFCISETFLCFLYNFYRIPICCIELMLLIKVFLLLLLILVLELLLLSIKLIEQGIIFEETSSCMEKTILMKSSRFPALLLPVHRTFGTSWWSQMCCLTIDTLCWRAIIYLRHIIILIIRR